jgi:hypothetical protein
MNLKKIGVIIGLLLFLGPLFSLFDISSFTPVKVFVAVSQLFLSIFLIISAIKYDENIASTAVRYKYACYGVIAYLFSFGIWFIFYRIFNSGGSYILIIIFCITMGGVLSPLVWCIKRLSQPKIN